MTEITKELVLSQLPPRLPDTHKGSYGSALLVCGSSRFRGAARLATEGALRIGAGLVTLAATEPVLGAVLPALPEAICLPMEAGREGGIGAQNRPALALAAKKADALLFGCGVGQSADTISLLETVLTGTRCPLVLDADGLNLLAEWEEPFVFDRPAVLTPHPGEMARLLKTTVPQVTANLSAAAYTCAKKYNAVVVMKDHRTLVATPQGKIRQNTTGNPGLARGGSGDLLAGMICGLLAQGLSAEMAAVCGVWLHGAAADLCAARLSMQCMLPHDIIPDLCGLLCREGR